MTPEVEIALIVGISSLSSPMILAWFTGRQLRASKKEDYARSDAVAAQAAEAARLLAEQQNMAATKAAEAATLLLASNERVAETADITLGKLDVIHTLVNSSLTAAMQSELDATISQVVLMKEIVGLKRDALRGTTTTTTTTEAAVALDTAEKRIKELTKGLADRKAQQSTVVQQEKAAAERIAEERLDARRRGEDLGF